MKVQPISRQNKVSFCLISNGSNDIWSQGLISYVNTDKKIVEIFLSANPLQDSFKAQDTVTVKSLDNQKGFLFSGRIKKAASSIYQKTLTVKIDDIKDFYNYRKDERYYVKFDASIRVPGRLENKANIIDISLGGVSLATDGKFTANTPVIVEVLVDPENPIAFSGNVLRRSRYRRFYKYGIMIEDIEDKDNKLLSELIKLLRMKKTRLAHKWKIINLIRYTLYSASAFLAFLVVFVILASKGI